MKKSLAVQLVFNPFFEFWVLQSLTIMLNSKLIIIRAQVTVYCVLLSDCAEEFGYYLGFSFCMVQNHLVQNVVKSEQLYIDGQTLICDISCSTIQRPLSITFKFRALFLISYISARRQQMIEVQNTTTRVGRLACLALSRYFWGQNISQTFVIVTLKTSKSPKLFSFSRQ